MHRERCSGKPWKAVFGDATRFCGTDGMPKCAVSDYAMVCSPTAAVT